MLNKLKSEVVLTFSLGILISTSFVISLVYVLHLSVVSLIWSFAVHGL